MSTPSTLTSQPLPPPHQHLDHRQRYLPSPQDRYLPPPRPSSNASSGIVQNIPARPSSNVSTHQLAPPPVRTPSGLSNSVYTSAQLQARSAAEHAYTNGHRLSNASDLRRTSSHSSQIRSNLPTSIASQSARAAYDPLSSYMASRPQEQTAEQASARQKRRDNREVDWNSFFGGKPPAEIITIHDDDSPPPTSSNQRLPPPATDASYSHHVDKRRRVNAAQSDAPAYSTTNTPYSQSHGASTESLQPTTAATSLGSTISSASLLDATQVGQKRKRTTRTTISEQNRLDGTAGPRGYLAQYGVYVPPLKQIKKQKDVVVPTIYERVKPTEVIDEEDGHYIVVNNTRLGEKYTLQKLLGQGTFGKVVRAKDNRTGKEYAIKIIRAVPKYRDASRIELRVLQTLRAADEHNRNRCIQLRDCFDWRGHICIVTPLLGVSVFDFLKAGTFVPFPGSHIQAFARQLLGSIAFLHDLNLIHTDLKPENILLLDDRYQTFTYARNMPTSTTVSSRSAKFRRVLLDPQINLIDFGSATFDDEYHSSVVSTRHYRAPEIILGIGWSHPIDLWSLGCILVECWTGDALFQTHDCCEHLAMMEAVIGQPIDKMLIREVGRTAKRNDRNSAARFFKNNHLAYPQADTNRQSRKYVKGMKRLEEIVPPNCVFNKYFLDFLRQIFVYDPKKRITAHQALKHPWFDELVEDDGTEAGRIKVERERQAARARAR